MGKYNTNISYVIAEDTYEGGTGYRRDPLEAWMNFICSSYMEDRYYEKAGEQTKHFLELTQHIYDVYGIEFIAKMAVFARKVLGMRSVSQLTAAFLNDKNFDGKRNFYHNFLRRVDDIGEIFAVIEHVFNGKISHGLMRGCKDYLETLPVYNLAKYKMNHKEWTLNDIINVTHAHSGAIDDFKRRVCEPPDTWEVKISQHTSELGKSKEWISLLLENKLGYLALIRNIRNIIKAAVYLQENSNVLPDYTNYIVDSLSKQITNKNAIKKSLVFPYQIYNAFKSYNGMPLKIAQALEEAFIISVDNIPTFEGTTLIIQDVSGSMDCSMSRHSNLTLKELGACYATMLLLKNPKSDVIKFGTNARLFSRKQELMFNPFAMIQAITDNDNLGYGTYVAHAFECIEKPYDRIFLISDMQCMDWNGVNIFNEYCRHNHCNPHLYSFDLGNYRAQFANPDNPRVHLLTSLNDTFLTMLPYIEDGHKLREAIAELPKPW